MRAFPTLLLSALLLLTAGCGDVQKDRQAIRDSVLATPPPPRPPVAGSSACPSDGRWTECILVDRISRAGLVFKPAGDSTRAAGMSVTGVRYKVGSVASLIAFFYADTVALAKDWAALDTVHLAPRGAPMPWPSIPVVTRSGNLVTALFDGSETQVERVQLAISAGPPQRSEPKATILPTVPSAR